MTRLKPPSQASHPARHLHARTNVPAGFRPRHRSQPRRSPQPARDRRQGAPESQPERLGLHRRRHRDRDDLAAQSPGARLDRVPAAGAARCEQDRCLGAASSGGGCACRWCSRRSARWKAFTPTAAPPVVRAAAAVRRRPYAQLGLRARPREGRRGRARRHPHVSALRPRRRRRSSTTTSAAPIANGYAALLPDRRYRDLQPARARHRQALRDRRPPARAPAASSRRRSIGARSSASRNASTSRWPSRASPPPRTPGSRSSTASIGSTSRTTAAASSTMAAAPWRCCPRSWRRSADARRS